MIETLLNVRTDSPAQKSRLLLLNMYRAVQLFGEDASEYLWEMLVNVLFHYDSGAVSSACVQQLRGLKQCVPDEVYSTHNFLIKNQLIPESSKLNFTPLEPSFIGQFLQSFFAALCSPHSHGLTSSQISDSAALKDAQAQFKELLDANRIPLGNCAGIIEFYAYVLQIKPELHQAVFKQVVIRPLLRSALAFLQYSPHKGIQLVTRAAYSYYLDKCMRSSASGIEEAIETSFILGHSPQQSRYTTVLSLVQEDFRILASKFQSLFLRLASAEAQLPSVIDAQFLGAQPGKYPGQNPCYFKSWRLVPVFLRLDLLRDNERNALAADLAVLRDQGAFNLANQIVTTAGALFQELGLLLPGEYISMAQVPLTGTLVIAPEFFYLFLADLELLAAAASLDALGCQELKERLTTLLAALSGFCKPETVKLAASCLK